MPRRHQVGSLYIDGHFPSPARVVVTDFDTHAEYVLSTQLLTNETEWGSGLSHVVIDLRSESQLPRGLALGSVRIETDSSGANNGHCYAGRGECNTMTIKEVAAYAANYSCSEDIVIELHEPFNLSAVRVNSYKDYIHGVQIRTALDRDGLGMPEEAVEELDEYSSNDTTGTGTGRNDSAGGSLLEWTVRARNACVRSSCVSELEQHFDNLIESYRRSVCP